MLMQRKKILIVDDMELNRAILGELFHHEYEIVEAENGRQAIDILKSSHQSLVALLLDIFMPEVDGFGVLQYLSSAKLLDKLPVFLITAETSADVAMQGYESGVVDVINKPITDPAIVRKRVNNAIELFQSRNDLESLVAKQVATIKAQAEKLKHTNVSIIDMLSTVIEFRSGESGQHVRRIRQATHIMLDYIAERNLKYHLTPSLIETISNAAAMHDLGKISVPDSILNKPGRLTAEEFEIMKKHSLYGCEMLERIPFFADEEIFKYCYDICRWHHERWDGKGYPDGLVGNETPIWAQIVAIADVYDALVSERVYKKAYPKEKAISMIKNGECGIFNPMILDCFLSIADYIYDNLYVGVASEQVQLRKTSNA